MNSTRWPSLTEFAKYLGREGICRVEDLDKGLHIAWIDNSPDALRRQDAIRKKERQDRGDEEREQKLIQEQIERAELDAEEKAIDGSDEEERYLKRDEGEKIILSFGAKPKEGKDSLSAPPGGDNLIGQDSDVTSDEKPASPPNVLTPPPEKVSLKIGQNGKLKNVFAGASKKNALGASKSKTKDISKKPMSEAERIMKEEIERKRVREANGSVGLNIKRQRIS